MLSFAKAKNWQVAYKVVQEELNSVTTDNEAAMTLLYNCALGAAVNEHEVLLSIYALMTTRKIKPNTTTVNTILSGYNKANRCDDAMAFYKQIANSNKDVNTYLMLLTILGRHRR
uniref:Protein Rf1, mitochondrial n=1 Tax=Lygus hesperus TaxID=30085 RepID=A0A0A9W2N7_LYGHE